MSGSDGAPGAGAVWAFGLLGELRVARAGRSLPPPAHRTRGLLALLLLRPDIRRRERLGTILFPDLSAPAGRRRLSDLLWLLRGALPDLRLDITADTVYFDPLHRWLDVEVFRRHAAGDSLTDWQRALDLYRGHLCEGVYDEWLVAERESNYLAYVSVARRVGEGLLWEGCGERAIPYLERLVRDEPYDEGALRSLMRAYHAVGRRGKALAVYERFQALAADELAIEPEEATRALVAWLREDGAASASPPVHADQGPDALLREGRLALARGDWARVEACLGLLRASPAPYAEGGDILEIDLALARNALARAEKLLAGLTERTAAGAALLVRAAEVALARHDADAATHLASEALLQAHQSRHREAELDALCALVRAHSQLGQGVQASRLAAQTLAHAREEGRAEDLVRALVLSGHSQVSQGQYARAMAHLTEAHALALSHGLRYHLIAALAGMRLAQCNTNRLSEARQAVQEELAVCRDLGLEHAEAEALEGLALVEDLNGRSGESLRALERANAISQRIGDPMRLAINQYNLACTLIYERDDQAPRAITEARRALECFRAHDRPGHVAAALTILGYALWVHGEYAASLHTLQEAVAACERAGQFNRAPELLAYQGLVHLGAGDPYAALQATRRAVLAMTQGEVSQEVVPEIYYAHAAALAANGMDDDSQAMLTRAYEGLLAGAAEIEDEAARQAFFQRNPTTRRLMGELRARGIVVPQGGGTITRLLAAQRGDRDVCVVWTVDAGPADAAVKRVHGAIALRRSRLSRLLNEAEDQGAWPTAAQLAEALGVSERTVQRDLAAMRGDVAQRHSR